ncbi:MAG: TRAP transporter substrate-binding protein [Bacteroidia bacterium]|jgi:TRAP-type C4-dicarboxylate transport system substrate-binding protein|nr:TRAP transporter substrate-binding protein [Bacteroidia bacterium]GIV22476.1 MAG: ABC transporter substrate-binding protein [Bacteroidia bacterium]
MRIAIGLAVVCLSALAQTKLRVGSTIPYDSPWEEAFDTYVKAVQEKAGPGKVTFRKFLSGQLGGEVEIVRSLRMGTLDIGILSVGGIAEGLSMPELLVLEMPFLFESDEEVDYVMDALFEEFRRRLEAKGLVLVLWGVNGWRNFGCAARPILSPADLKGLKMRAQETPIYIEMYKALGATPVPIATPEVLMALKNRMVDGFDQTVVFAVSTGWMGQIKHYTLSRHIFQPGAIVISKKTFDRLPPDIQKALLVADKRAVIQAAGRKLVRDEEQSILASIEKEGNVQFYRLTPQQRETFRKALQAAMPRLEAALGPEGKVLMAQVRNKVMEFRKKKAVSK